MSIPTYSPPAIKPARLLILALFPCVCAVAITLRLIHLNTFGGEEHRKRAENQHTRKIEYPELRGRLFDADRRELASSTFAETLYVRPRFLLSQKAELSMAADVMTSLALALQMPEDELFDALETTRSTVVLKRRMSPTMARSVRAVLTSGSITRLDENGSTLVDSRGWWMRKETIRSYTRGEFAPHVVGYTIPNEKGDAEGMDGLEKHYNSSLNATTATARPRFTALGTQLTPVDPSTIEKSFGSNIVLTLNNTIQKTAEQALAEQVQAYHAESGVCVVVDVKTGALLAVANVPTFDLNARPGTSDLQRRNRAISDGYEPGSVMKTFTYLSALDAGRLQARDSINCEGGTWATSGRVIRDAGRKHGTVAAAVAFADSSNVGAVKVAMKLSKESYYRRLKSMGFGQRTGIDLPGETGGLLFPLSKWSDQSVQSLSFGYEMRATAIQLAMAGAAIANEGYLMRPYVVKEILDHRGEVTSRTIPQIRAQIASPEACHDLMSMMALTVIDGTGKLARMDGWTAGGKTGTTKLVDPATKKYSNNLFVSSFLGIAPLESPQIAVYVSIRRPDPRYGTGGGAVAAPVFKVVGEAAMRALRVPPSPDAGRPQPNPAEMREKILQELRGRVPAHILNEVIDPAEGEEPSPQPATENSRIMPDLAGMSLREAMREISARGWSYEVEGSGMVTEHWPRPHETLSESVHVRLRLAPVQQRLQEIARYASPSAELPKPGALMLASAKSTPTPDQREEVTDEPTVRLRRGNQIVELEVMPIADTAASSRMSPTRNQEPEFPAGEAPTAAAELDPPTPGKAAQVWGNYFAEQSEAAVGDSQ